MPRRSLSRQLNDALGSERAGVAVVAVAAAVGAVASGASPTGWTPADVVLDAAAAVVVVLAFTRARRTAWLATAGLASVFAGSRLALLCAAAAVAIAFVASMSDQRRSALVGAVTGGLVVQALFRQDVGAFLGADTLWAGVAVLPVAVSGYRHSRRSTRRAVRRTAVGALGLALVATVGFAVASMGAYDDIDQAVAAAEAGLDAARDGDRDAAVADLERSAAAFDRAQDQLRAPWTWPAQAVPVVGQHVAAVREATSSGHEITSTAATSASQVSYDELTATGGQVDLAELAAAQVPVTTASDALLEAQVDLADVDSPWLLAPVADQLDELQGRVDEAAADASLAVLALDVAPGLLGADGARDYLIAFATPAESRNLGGFIGSWGQLTTDGGSIDLTASGRINELSSAPGFAERQLVEMTAFEQRYAEWFPTRFLQNATVSPDFPTAAEALAQLYPQAGGRPVAGVIYVDPFGLAALLELTGPVPVPGLDQPLTADNAVDLLLRDQYLDYQEADERADLLADALEATFQALTEGDLPGPRAMGEVLGPAVQRGNLLVEVFDDDERALFERLDTRGEFPAPEQGDFLSLRANNGGGNKLDAYLERDVRYQVGYDPVTAEATATATVVLRNTAPVADLPEYVVGNPDTRAGRTTGDPPGTNRMQLTLHSALDVDEVLVDGQPVASTAALDFGRPAESVWVEVPPSGELVVTFRLAGRLDVGDRYRLAVSHQPMATPDRLTVEVATTGDAWVPEATGGDPVVVTEELVDDVVVEVPLRRTDG